MIRATLPKLAMTLTAAAVLAACNPFGGASVETESEKFSYSVGVDIGKSLETIRDDLDMAALSKGLDDVMAENELLMDDAARREIQTVVAQKLREKHMKKQAKEAESAVAEGETFLAENGKKDGVKTTASGLQYRVLTAGTGAQPSAADTVTVHYKGTLLNGDTFDSSYDRGEPATFKLNQVIPGWTEGVQLMKVGSKYEFVIPAALAYGEQGAGGKIGPNQVLKFDVELLDIKK